MSRSFFVVDDDGCKYYLVAADMDHARRILRDAVVESGDPPKSIVDDPEVTWIEIGTESASKIMCNTDDDSRNRGRIPLSECDIGEWFSTEW